MPLISLTMARLRVLKQISEFQRANRASDFTHYGPFEGTETNSKYLRCCGIWISLTMARLRVLKLVLVSTNVT